MITAIFVVVVIGLSAVLGPRRTHLFYGLLLIFDAIGAAAKLASEGRPELAATMFVVLAGCAALNFVAYVEQTRRLRGRKL